ncbi:MAG: MBL fold metallo-hydrolase [Deltaproteobacteria bacterium]|nr:MAG: MBL fold metallo-hydrolase [Deltaproteobacteria bacterium]
MIKVTCLGAAGTVTGSNYLVEDTRGNQILVDCGLFQGGRLLEMRNWMEWGFSPDQIETMFLTHAHIDHSGRIPKLVKDGFRGKILTSRPSAELCEIMLLDSAHIQEMDAEWQTRKNKRKGHREVQPLYTIDDAKKSLTHLRSIERDEIINVRDGIRARLRNAGHILGSSILELWVKEGDGEIKVVFSGDLGKANQLILKEAAHIFKTDYLFIESTYGNRLHKPLEDSKQELLEAINYAVSNNEKIIIPSFAVERTQEIIYILGEFYRKGTLPEIPIYLDSPLAIKATEIFRKNKEFYDKEALAIVEAGFDPFNLPHLRYTPSTKESIAINEQKGSAIVIAGNGMCTAGRIKHHLKHNLWRDGASIVIVGFQAQGTTGRQIVEGRKSVKIFREDVAVNARVFTIGGFSSHADQKDLLDWVGNFKESQPKVFTVHGEPESSKALADKIHETYGFETYVPKWKEALFLKRKEEPIEVRPLAAEERPVASEVLVSLDAVEKQIASLRQILAQPEAQVEVSEADLDRLNYVQEELKQILAKKG